MSNIVLTRIDKRLMDIVMEVYRESYHSQLKPILIGGKSLNLLLKEIRYSEDSDFALITHDGKNEVSKSQLKSFSKKVRKKIENEYNIQIKKFEEIDEESKSIFKGESGYIHIGFLIRITIFIDKKRYKLELSTDPSIPKLETKTTQGYESITEEMLLAQKTVIAGKRILLNELDVRENFRHIYDVYRLFNEIYSIDYEKLMYAFDIMIKYENERKINNNSWSNIKFNLESIILSLVNLISDENSLNDVIDQINETYGKPLNRKRNEFKNVIEKYIKELKKINNLNI